MNESKSPTDVTEIKEKIDNGQVKVKRRGKSQNKVKSKKTNMKGVKGANGNICDNDILAYLKEQDKYVTSTEIRDGLQFVNRTQARRVLKRLAKAGKVNIKKCKISDKRRIYTYGIA